MELISNRELHKPSIYLISPTSVDSKTFPSLLESVLSSGLISVFQLRVKKYSAMANIQIIEKLYKLINIAFKVLMNIYKLNKRNEKM